MRNSTRIIGAVLLVLACLHGPAWADQDKLEVFYLNSYHNGYRWSDRILEGVRTGLMTKSTAPIELQIEYMDSKKYNFRQLSNELLAFYTKKYSGEHFDIVIVSDNNALSFILEHGEALFPGVPIVFCGINDYDPKLTEGRAITGVVEEFDPSATFELAMRLHPEKKRVVVVCDSHITGVAIRHQVEKVIPSFEGRLDFEFWEVGEMSSGLERIASIPDDTFAYFIPMFKNIDGKYYTAEELVRVMAEHTHAPFYSSWDYLLGHGIVGGKFINSFLHGQAAADIALRVLEGEDVTSIPVINDNSTAYMFDWKVLDEHHIDHALLPEDSLFINQPQSFYELDKEIVWVILVSLGILLLILILLAKNVMRRKEVEQTLKQQLAFMNTLLDTIPLLICWKDLEQRFQGVNRSFMDFYHIKGAEDILNRRDMDVPMAEQTAGFIKSLDQQVIDTEEPIRKYKSSILHNSGEESWLELNKVPLRDELGRVIGTLTTADNITREINLERQLVQSQKMEAIGTLAGGLAHDFNNILTSIINSTELVLMGMSDPQDQRDLERVLKASNRGSELVKQILTFSRPTTEGFVNTVIADAISEALNLVERTIPRNIVLRTNIQARETVIFADPTQIHQVVMNLCTNSYQALRKSSGFIEASLVETTVDTDLAQLLDALPGRYLKLTIADNGPGIPHEIIDKVFDPFFTTKGKTEGTGLGLAVVHGIVKSHKGAIRLTSKPHERTSMEIFFPIQRESRTSPVDQKDDSCPGLERLLFIEDDEDQLATIPRVLRTLGYRVTPCDGADQALRLLRSGDEHFDLVLTDFDMPGLSGLELAEILADEHPGLKVIMFSGREIASQAVISPGNIAAVLRKPYNKSSLSVAIRQALC